MCALHIACAWVGKKQSAGIVAKKRGGLTREAEWPFWAPAAAGDANKRAAALSTGWGDSGGGKKREARNSEKRVAQSGGWRKGGSVITRLPLSPGAARMAAAAAAEVGARAASVVGGESSK